MATRITCIKGTCYFYTNVAYTRPSLDTKSKATASGLYVSVDSKSKKLCYLSHMASQNKCFWWFNQNNISECRILQRKLAWKILHLSDKSGVVLLGVQGQTYRYENDAHLHWVSFRIPRRLGCPCPSATLRGISLLLFLFWPHNWMFER